MLKQTLLFLLSPAFWLPVIHLTVVLSVSVRVLLRRDLAPDTRLAWLLLAGSLPFIGFFIYLLFGEVPINRIAATRQQAAQRTMFQAMENDAQLHHLLARHDSFTEQHPASAYAASINGFALTQGNAAELLHDDSAARASLLQDIHTAQAHVHLLYYIWLPDATGQAVAEATMRAAQRGVDCRVLVDAVGSRSLLQSPLWAQMQAAGVKTAVAMPIGRWWSIFLRSERLDVRNHRKISIIDGRVLHCGSQNCADAAFAPKAKYAPWVDVMLRLQGPVVAQMQMVFASDWAQATGQSVVSLLPTATVCAPLGRVAAQVVASGPSERSRATAQLLCTLIAGAQKQLSISTPYFVPDATVLQALLAASLRGVQVRLILPHRNDSWIVAMASHSHYQNLLEAGIEIFEYTAGLLHAKTLTVDGRMAFVGSTNIDMRSFGLNYENNVLLQDEAVVQSLIARQESYMADAISISLAQVRGWSRGRRMLHNSVATLSPLL